MAEIEGFRRRRLDWMNAYIAAGCNPRGLPQVATSHADGRGYPTFADAIKQADTIVVGRVTAIVFYTDPNFEDFAVSDATIKVDRALKGDVSGKLVLHQLGGPAPDHGGELNHLSGDPVLLPGDDVLVLAASGSDTTEGKYLPLVPVGKYYVRDGSVYAPDGNPCDVIDGRSLNDTIELIAGYANSAASVSVTPQACDWSRY